jgi:hypothetical protein
VVINLALDLAPFNIRTSLLMSGYCRTGLVTPGNIHHRASRPLAEYDEMRNLVAAGCAAANGQQKRGSSKGRGSYCAGSSRNRALAWEKVRTRFSIGEAAIRAIRRVVRS